MFYKRFAFAVSVCALFAVDAAWAAYSDVDTSVTGLAGASYVAQLVNSAGQAANAAATAAENAASAAEKKVNIAQGPTYANKAVITNASGNITTGTIGTGMIKDGAVTGYKIATGAVTSLKIAQGTIANEDIADSAVNSAKIADGTITNSDISSTAKIATSKISGLATVATSGSYADLTNQPTVGKANLTIKNGATSETIATFGANATTAATALIPAATPTVAGLGKIGVIPSGSETSSTYATIWVE